MDEHAFQSFYAATARDLRAYVARASGDYGRVDDIVQESYLRMLRMAAFPGDLEQRRRLLFRVASNLMADEWRRKRREQQVDVGAMRPIASKPDPSLRLDMVRVFQQLSPRQRQMMWLAYVEG